MLLYFILRTLISSLKNKKSFKNTDIYKGFALYVSTPSNDRKNICKVVYEMEKLSWYWRTFPTSYFMFHMHLKEFDDYERMKTFVPQGFYAKYAGSTKYDILIDDKILFHDIMTMYGLPVTKQFFTFRNNLFYINNIVVSEEEIDKVISNITDNRIFVKRYLGGGGSGVFIFIRKKDGYYNETNNKLTASFIKTNYNGTTLLFEKQIKQHSVLKTFNPDTVNTLRVIVIKNPMNKIQIVGAAARFGRIGNFIDNASQGGIMVGLNIQSGQLEEYGSRLYDLNKYYSHPDSKLLFKHTKVSEWRKVENLVYKTMGYLPFYRAVAFDVANTYEGPIIIEINTGAGINAPQIGKEKGIAEYFF